MQRSESQGAGAVQLTAAVLMGGLLALGIVLLLLLLGAVAVSRGILKEETGTQLTALACVLGCFVGGKLTSGRWPSRRLLAGLGAGAVCFLLILAVGLITSDGFDFGLQGLLELAACLCGGAVAGLLSRGKKRGKRVAGRSR